MVINYYFRDAYYNHLMKPIACFAIFCTMFIACNNETATTAGKWPAPSAIEGTWKLMEGITVENNDSVITDYTKDKSFIKIITATHFAFMGHDLVKGNDSATAFFSSGGGTYQLSDSNYTEHLEYCNARGWENNDFHFTVSLRNDTLVQWGVEKIDSIGVNRVNIEKYVRVQP